MSTLLRLSVPRLQKVVNKVVKPVPFAVTGGDVRFTVYELRCALERRGMSDREAHAIFVTLYRVLEPPGCSMSHCEHFGGGGSPMNCADERVPGRCSIFRNFKLRQDERAKKANEVRK